MVDELPSDETIRVNRAPVLTLWAAVVAERLGYDQDEALSLAKALAGLNAQTKGRSLGIFRQPAPAEAEPPADGRPPAETGRKEEFWVTLCGRPVPAIMTGHGIRAVKKDEPIEPEPVRTYLAAKFGAQLERARAAMRDLAAAYEPAELEGAAYGLYEILRPSIPSGKSGWGKKGDLDLELIRSLSRRGRR